MSINLIKGQNINLSKEAAGLVIASLGLGWDAVASGKKIDLDASALILNEQDKLAQEKNFVYFRNLKSPDGSVVHSGDNLTGEGDGDDETISVNLNTLPEGTTKVLFVVNSYSGQNFGQVKNAFIRLYNQQTNEEIAKYDLTEDYSVETLVVFGELYKKDGEWKFKGDGVGERISMESFISRYQ